MLKGTYFFLLMLVICSVSVFPQDKPIITVLDFETNEVSHAEMRSIITLISSVLFKTNHFTVIDVSQRETVLKEQKFSLSGSSDESSMLEVGKLLSAEAIIVGSIGRVGSKYVLSVKLLETETATTMNTADGIYKDLDELLNHIYDIAVEIAEPYAPAHEIVEKFEPEQDQNSKRNNDNFGITSSGVFSFYSLGDTGPAGGVIFYIDEANDFIWDYLEAAPIEQSSSHSWIADSLLLSKVNLKTSTDLGTGSANTDDIIAQTGNTESAAKICRDYSGGGFTDWFLPSKDELNLMYKQKEIIGDISIGGFYWSSSEDSQYNAWFQMFQTSHQLSSPKSSRVGIRAIRAF
ncbi:MAG: hypothetical protein PF638_14725 [Candidatus Delongbacteria bacterium]|jgi:TolB-like protein|nr:hypothetical protein [Candidatus Delongbacteria bacterium]